MEDKVVDTRPSDNEQVIRRRPERAPGILHQHPAGQVHVCLWLDEAHGLLDAGQVALRHLRLAVLLPAVEVPAVCQVVHEPPAHIVAGVLVLLPGIAEAHDDLHWRVLVV